LVGQTDYEFAIEHLFPLIQRLEIQRGLQNASFYARLRNDLKIGCIIPPITLAFIVDQTKIDVNIDFIKENIQNGFVLDGIQRLSAIHRAAEEIESEKEKSVFLERVLHLNVIISPSMDRLLYRMITLNNGQKPMSPRHQIDMLFDTIIDFETLSLKNQPHKQRQQNANKLAIHRSDVIKGYLAFLSDTTAIDNKLIIEEKMDDLIAERIIDSDIRDDKYEFIGILNWIAGICQEKIANDWFILSNNFIGFCVATRRNFDFIKTLDVKEFEAELERFEEIFSNFDKRKIKVGDYRRKMAAEYFSDLKRFSSVSISDVILELSQR
jgi:hypothetical protein